MFSTLPENYVVQQHLADLHSRSGLSIRRTGLPDSEIQWHYIPSCTDLDHTHRDLKIACANQLEFINDFKKSWASTESQSLEIPLEWIPSANTWERPLDLFRQMHMSALNFVVGKLDRNIKLLTQDQVIARHDDPNSFTPDFMLCKLPFESYHFPSIPQGLLVDLLNSLPSFLGIALYSGDEDGIDSAIPGLFQSLPGCSIRSDFGSDISKLREGYIPPTSTFSVLLNPISQRISYNKTELDIINPAIVVSMKGPASFPLPPSAVSQPKPRPSVTSDEMIHKLSQLIQPHLTAHIMNWHLRCEQICDIGSSSLPSYRSLPPWMMLFGILYDADGLTIIAHVPFLTDLLGRDTSSESLNPLPSLSFLSCVVDHIPMTGIARAVPNSGGEPPILSNVRAALALFAIQKQAFMLTTLWDGVMWPTSITHPIIDHDSPERPDDWSSTLASGDDFPFFMNDIIGEETEESNHTIQEREAHKLEAMRPIIMAWLETVDTHSELSS